MITFCKAIIKRPSSENIALTNWGFSRKMDLHKLIFFFNILSNSYFIVLKLGTSHIVKHSEETESRRFFIGLNFKTYKLF